MASTLGMHTATSPWTAVSSLLRLIKIDGIPPGGGELPYETDGDARRKIRIKPLKETKLGVAQALFDP